MAQFRHRMPLTITSTATVGPAAAKRQVTQRPSSIPAYASACSGAARYSSACSCVGAVRHTITIAAPSTTKTQTITVSAFNRWFGSNFNPFSEPPIGYIIKPELNCFSTVGSSPPIGKTVDLQIVLPVPRKLTHLLKALITVPATASTVVVTKLETTTLSTSTTVITSNSISNLDTVTVTSTATVVTTTTTTPASQPSYTTCSGPPYGNAGGVGIGGCRPGCYCDQLTGDEPSGGFCENATTCGQTYSSTADCPSGSACTSSYLVECGRNVCLDYRACVGTGAKMMAIRGAAMGRKEVLASEKRLLLIFAPASCKYMVMSRMFKSID
ncbi:hypothetical protein VTL71DRAFT_15270 [Oculimacula yallundae]|uniref:Uncharacterized protein n=1 Tax=Oculimacula yallundae TaxID=86028 RepID=A0ABR4CG35_9HELO